MPLKRKHDPGYKLPEVIDPEETCCICIPIPNDFNHKMAFLGQLDELGYWWNWERDPLKQGTEAAAVWRKIVACIREEMSMSDCGCSDKGNPTNQRYTEDGHLEVSYDGGETWENADAIDPRFNSPIFSPIGGADGSTKRCQAANSAIAVIEGAKSDASSVLAAAGGFAGLVAAVVGLLASTGIGIVAAVVIGIMGAILVAVAQGGQAAFDGSFTSLVWDELFCSLFCHMEDDGSFTEAGWQAVMDETAAGTSYPANEWLTYIIKTMSPVGLTNAARSGYVGTRDCDSCDCDEVWCYEWNFLTTNGGFTATFGTWTLGQGWVGTTAGSGKSIFLQKAMSMTTVTHVEADVVYNPRGNLNIKVGTTSTVTPENVLSGTYSWDGSVTDDDITLNPSSGASQGNSVRLTRLLMRGIGTNPFSETNNCE